MLRMFQMPKEIPKEIPKELNFHLKLKKSKKNREKLFDFSALRLNSSAD